MYYRFSSLNRTAPKKQSRRMKAKISSIQYGYRNVQLMQECCLQRSIVHRNSKDEVQWAGIEVPKA